MKVIAVIPVKSTSSRIHNKNIKLLCNMPLFLHTLEKLLKINDFDEIWIDTDSIDIINIAKNYGYKNFNFFIREKKFADNSTNGNLLLENEIKNIQSDIYVQILCTSPFLNIDSIKKSVFLLKNNQYKSVVGCFSDKLYLWKNGTPLYDKINIPNSNTLDDTIIESMSLYAITKDEFFNAKTRIGSNPFLLLLEGEECIDINYEKDFLFANKIAIYNKFNEQNLLNLLKIKLNSCILSDLLHTLKHDNCFLSNFKTNIKNNKLFGRVRLLQIRHLNIDENINNIYNCLDSYKNINYGDIIIVNNLINNKAYFGDLNATIAISKNAQGTIINGCTRDISRTIDLNYPVFYKSIFCNDVKGFGTLDFYDEPIIIDNIKIFVNNLIFADSEGIVIIPKEIEDIVINECKNIIKNELNISNNIVCGENLNTILNKFGFF